MNETTKLSAVEKNAPLKPALSIKSIVYLLQVPLKDRDITRYGIDVMLSHGVSVTVIDVGDIVLPHLKHDRSHYSRFKGFQLRAPRYKRDFAREQSAVEQADLVVCLAQSQGVSRRNLPVMRLIAKAGTPFLIWSGALMPAWDTDLFYERVDGRITKFLQLLLTKDYLNSVISRLPRRWFGIPDAAFMLQSSPGIPRSNPLVGPNTRQIFGHTPDYDTFRKEKRKNPIVRNQAVFLDQFLPFHPDFIDSGTRSVEPGPYYAALRGLFDRIERELNLEVVIAPHPRADYSTMPEVFGGRPILNSTTAQAVLESRLVIAGGTTAVSFAVMARCPLLLVATRPLYTVGIERHFIDALSQALGMPVRWIDEPETIDLSNIFMFDESCYNDYIATYIKSPESPDKPLWEIALEAVE